MSKKRVPEPHEVLMYSSETRMPRRTPLAVNGAQRAKGTKAIGDQEVENHQKAIAEYRDRCRGADPWRCAEALLYLVDGDRIVEKYGLWLFPSDTERFLVSTNEEGADEFYILARLEGKACLDKLSLGVSKDSSGQYSHSHGKLSKVDPTDGQVIRIVSIEGEGEDLQSPEDASFSLQHARHIREVIRKHAGKCDSGVSAPAFRVLRTQAYVAAKDALESENCGPDEWAKALHEVENPASFPWKLANRVAEMGVADKLRGLELGTTGRVHVTDDIWLVEEKLPSASSEFMVAARWAVHKSIKGTGSIPRAKMWEPVVILNESSDSFQLMRMA